MITVGHCYVHELLHAATAKCMAFKIPKKHQMLLVCNGCLQSNSASTIALDMVVAMALVQRCSLQLHMLRRFLVQGTLPHESSL